MEENKIVLKVENSRITYKYLSDLKNKYAPEVNFNFQFKESKTKDEYETNIYNVYGKSPMKSFYKFIQHIENQPPLYTITNFSIKEVTDYDELHEKVRGQGENSERRIAKYQGHTEITIPMSYGMALI